MRLVSCLLACVAIPAAVWPAWAAPATDAQAQSIRTVLERYLGTGGAVSVKPDGERYRVEVDIKKLARGLEPLGVVLDPFVAHVDLQPQDDGLWHVTEAETIRINAKVGERTISGIMNNATFDGIFDPKIPGFTRSTTTYDSMTTAGLNGGAGTQTRTVQNGKMTAAAEQVSDGVINLKGAQTTSGSTQDFVLDPPGAAAPEPKRLAVKSGPSTENLQVTDFHIRSILDVWAFFVAHPSLDAVKASQEELRTLLRQALPLFSHWAQGGEVGATTVDSPLGTFGVRSASAQADLNGFVPDGRVGLTIKTDALAIPAGLAPAWTDGLVPTGIDLSATLSGFHPDAVAQHAVNSFDLANKDLFTPEAAARFKTLIGSPDDMLVTIAPSRLVSRLLDAKVQGTVRPQHPLPTVDVTVTVAGLDKAMEEIQAKAADDKNAASAIAVIAMAKGFGKAQPDGSLVWHVTSDSTGSVLINGIALPIAKQR